MTESELVDDAFTVRPLAPATWDAFADLAERHNGGLTRTSEAADHHRRELHNHAASNHEPTKGQRGVA